jgi:hypothetical protein
MRFEIVNVTEDVVVKRTDNQAEAQDYYEQCVRGCERFHARYPDTKLVEYIMREVA